MRDPIPRVLIIDGEQDSVALLSAHLKQHGFDVQMALDGVEGLGKAALGQPDLILLNASMPDQDGFAVCRRLKEDFRTRQIPVIFLSGRSGIEDKLEGFASGGIDYITKPFSEAEALARNRTHIKTRQRMESLEALAGLRLLESAEERPDLEQTLFAKGVQLLEQHLATPPTLAGMAHGLGTNERKLTQAFRRKAGMSVFEYLAELRLETARRLLESSKLQIQLIGDRVGYRNAGDFTRAYRRRYGLSPREYRRALSLLDEESP